MPAWEGASAIASFVPFIYALDSSRFMLVFFRFSTALREALVIRAFCAANKLHAKFSARSSRERLLLSAENAMDFRLAEGRAANA